MLGAVARPATISVPSIVAAGREIGLADLSLRAVADRLGVTRAALYRHVRGRAELEELVGEHILAENVLPPDQGGSLERYLEDFAVWLRDLCTDVPGLADYMARRFPRSTLTAHLMEQGVSVIAARGWTPTQSLFISSAVAGQAIAMVRSEQEATSYDDSPLPDPAVDALMEGQPLLAAAWPAFRAVAAETRFRWYMRCTIHGALVVAERDLSL